MSVIIKEKFTLPSRSYDLMLNWCYQKINTQNPDNKDRFYRKLLLINEYVEETKSIIL